MTIPDEAVEAAAEAIYEIAFGPVGWVGLPAKPKQQYIGQARHILEAAAAHMQASNGLNAELSRRVSQEIADTAALFASQQAADEERQRKLHRG